MILFGVTMDKMEAAVYASLYISLLVFFPAALEFGFKRDGWMSMISTRLEIKSKRFQILFYSTLLCSIIAPIVHPLDWQRDWQVIIII